MTIEAAELLHGMSADTLAELTGVHVTTCRRWVREKRVPPPIARLLGIVRRGDLGVIAPAWAGWRLVRDYGVNDATREARLVSPEGWDFTPGDIIAGRVLVANGAARELEREELAAEERAALADEERRRELDALIVLKNATGAATQALERLTERLTRAELERLHFETGGREAAVRSWESSERLAEILGEESHTHREKRGFIVVPELIVGPVPPHLGEGRLSHHTHHGARYFARHLAAQPWWQEAYGGAGAAPAFYPPNRM